MTVRYAQECGLRAAGRQVAGRRPLGRLKLVLGRLLDLLGL